jgi:hypothetical protein
VLKLRFVQEYRGRRIVTDGKLFGIDGELITDCRYLGLQGAHGAIDSELTIEASKTLRAHADVRRISVESAEYFEDYRTRSFACECGWHGCYNELKPMQACCSFVVCCPTCGHPLLSIRAPSVDEIKGAAARTNEEALAMLPSALESEKAEEAWLRQALQRVSQLPELADDALAFVLDLEHDGGDNYYVIELGEQRVWRELARAGDRQRFYELKRLLKKKYNRRFVSLTPTAVAKCSLDDGNTRAKRSVA